MAVFVRQVVARYIEPLVAILIVANGVMIGFQTDPCLSTPESNEGDSRWVHEGVGKNGWILTTARVSSWKEKDLVIWLQV